MALLPIEDNSGEEDWLEWVTLVCKSCEVTWRGVLYEPCWLCTQPGKQPSGMTLVKD